MRHAGSRFADTDDGTKVEAAFVSLGYLLRQFSNLGLGRSLGLGEASTLPSADGGGKLPTSSSWQFSSRPSAVGFHSLHARIAAELVGAAKKILLTSMATGSNVKD